MARLLPVGRGMAKRVEELECWRLADRLRSEVYAICAQKAVAARFRFCDGFTEAAGSVCRNLSEGFHRVTSSMIVQFFGYALASLGEVKEYLKECRDRKFIDDVRYEQALDLSEHVRATTLNFMRHHQNKLRRARERDKRTK